MNSKHPSIRVLGQRSLPSTFLFRSLKRSNDCKEDEQIKVPEKNSRPSLSDFLNRRLQKSSVLAKSIQGKEMPFSSPVSRGDVSGSIERENDYKKRGDAEVNCALDVAFEQLKHDRKETEDCLVALADGEVGSSSTHQMQESRKRRNQFEEGDGRQSARKILVVLGDDPKPKQKGKRMSFLGNEKPKPIFNHYANGGGWWDCNMEGVDNDEVGCDEAWEGIGSTTLGGLEWH